MNNGTPQKSYRNRLMDELVLRQNRNPAYSLRSFARDLDISPATLCQTLSMKRSLSKASLLKVAEQLAFSPMETHSALREISAKTEEATDESFTTLSEDTFKMMSDWYYFAILSLAQAGRAKADAEWLANHFEITTIQAADAIERLLRLQLIEIKNDFIVYDGRPLKTTNNVPSSAARQLQHQHLQLAKTSLERDRLDLRDMTSMTMAIDINKIPEAKEMVKKFRRKIAKFLEGDGKGEQVYVLALQLFPVSKSESK